MDYCSAHWNRNPALRIQIDVKPCILLCATFVVHKSLHFILAHELIETTHSTVIIVERATLAFHMIGGNTRHYTIQEVTGIFQGFFISELSF